MSVLDVFSLAGRAAPVTMCCGAGLGTATLVQRVSR